MVPDAPTIIPATIMAVLFNAKPPRRPTNWSAFSREMTTALSAPPIGSNHHQPQYAGRRQRSPPQRRAAVAGMRCQADHHLVAANRPTSSRSNGCCAFDPDRPAGNDLRSLSAGR